MRRRRALRWTLSWHSFTRSASAGDCIGPFVEAMSSGNFERDRRVGCDLRVCLTSDSVIYLRPGGLGHGALKVRHGGALIQGTGSGTRIRRDSSSKSLVGWPLPCHRPPPSHPIHPHRHTWLRRQSLPLPPPPPPPPSPPTSPAQTSVIAPHRQRPFNAGATGIVAWSLAGASTSRGTFGERPGPPSPHPLHR